MKLHRTATTCPNSRALIARRVLREGWTRAAAAEAAGVSVRTARKWVGRAEAGDSLEDRSSRPKRSPSWLARRQVEAIEALRRLWMTAGEIAEVLRISLSTVSLWLKRIGLGKRSRLAPPEPANRYERRHPGELVQVDIKTLGRISVRGAGHRIVGPRKSQIKPSHGRPQPTGFEYLHVMVDDHSRLAYAEVLEGLTSDCAVRFLRRAVSWFAERGVRIQAVMSDNGSCYVSHGAPRGAARTRPAPSADQALPAPDQRQGRALHPDTAQRMGLGTPLRQLHRARRRPTARSPPIQLQATARLPRQTGSSHKSEQPRWERHLARRNRRVRLGLARYGARVDNVRLPDPRLTVGGGRLGCTTRLAYAGAYRLTIWTIVPELAAELRSSYLGHPDGHTAVAHLRLRLGEPPVTVAGERSSAELPVREARRLCLYDHLAALRQLVADATRKDASVDVADQALELVDLA